MGALLCLVTLLRMGMLEWLDDPGWIYFRLLPAALLFFAAGITIERRGQPADSRYFYPIAVTFTLIAFTGLAAAHEPYRRWLESVAPWTRGQIEYLFIINAGIYLVIQSICEYLPWAQMRSVARAFRFVLPGHVLTSLLLLGLNASAQWSESPASESLKFEARIFEVLLPCAAFFFVFGSVPKQMKNFFAWGMVFFAIGIVRLQDDLFKDNRIWLISLLTGGLLLMLAATNYAAIKVQLLRRIRRRL